MTRAMRWLVTVVAAAATFGVCVWVVRAVSWGWLPQGEGPGSTRPSPSAR